MFRFLFPNYAKAGAGIDRNAPKKQGLPLIIETLSREFTNLLKLNFIFLIFCIPIVTIGPAIGALTSVTIKMVKDEPVDWFYDFKEAFKKNWKQSFVLGILQSIVAIVIGCAFLYYFQLTGIAYYCMMFIISVISAIVFMSFIYLYPMTILVNLKIKDIVKNSYLLSIINIKYSIITLAVCLLVFVAGIMLRFVTIPIILLFFSISFSCFICSFCAYGPIERNIIK